ncbi:alpha/beta hydrolase [Microbaculum marinum]|uniref:Alpha/beta hydrolase n=1 Tax=Microbaculum marinum TaxID=1764581 RepID=A0AAW9RNV3_9HYPH
MNATDYEAEYNNRARVPEHPAIIEGWARDAAAFREQAECETAISYGGRARNRLDLFLPGNGAKVDRLAVFIHGGYWQGLDNSFFSHMARGALAHGLAVAVPTYTLCPEVRIGDIVAEMRLACDWLWDRFRVPMAVSGHSAGGHLAAALLASEWEPGGPEIVAAQPISGLFDLAPLIPTSLNGALRLDEAEARDQSPLFWPAPAGRRLHAWVGGEESGEFHRQCREIARTWGAAGVETSCTSLDGTNHFTVIAPLADPDSEMTRDLVALATA